MGLSALVVYVQVVPIIIHTTCEITSQKPYLKAEVGINIKARKKVSLLKGLIHTLANTMHSKQYSMMPMDFGRPNVKPGWKLVGKWPMANYYF